MHAFVGSPLDELVDADSAIDWAFSCEGQIFRDVDGRRTSRVDVNGRSLFVKTYTGATHRETLKNWLTLRSPSSSAKGELQALERMHQSGIPVPSVVAWAYGSRSTRETRSFIATEDIGTQDTIGHRLDELLIQEPSPRRALIEEVARLTARMHAAGVNHRDLYLVHFALLDRDPRSPSLAIMDFHRAQMRSRVPLRWRAKDLGSLLFSAEDARLSRADKQRFMRTYTRHADSPLRAHVWQRTADRARALVRERARRGERFGG